MNPIYTLITAVMLTACVGSVNIPADETKKTDDPEAQKMAEVETETEMMDEPKIPPPNPCIANPFGDGCNDYEQQSFCGIRANADDSRCATILGRTNIATWLQGFSIPLLIPWANNETSFLRISADGTIDTTGIAINSADAKTLTRAGDSNDGVLYYKGTPDGETIEQFFAGILPTTDLGLPVPATEPSATWTGSYRRSNTAIVNNVSFHIDFENRTIDARAPFAESNDIDRLDLLLEEVKIRQIRASIGGPQPMTDTSRLLIFDLNFTPSGVIDGIVLFYYTRTIDRANASGLIGQDGLVGVFVDSEVGFFPQLQNFYGGFWAEPPE